MRRRQCAARSSVRIAKVRNPFNWSMADAWCSFLSLLTWYLYFLKKSHQCCYSTEFLVGTLVVVGEQKKSWINKNLCRNSTAGFRKWHNKSSPWNFAENEHEFIRNCHKGFNILWLVHENAIYNEMGANTNTAILQLQQILRLPRKMNLMIDPHHIWNVIYNARSNKSHPPTWPNTAPATQNESHDWSASHMKRHLQCAEQQESSSNFTKYCACHAKWISWLIRITYETSFTMRGATSVILQPHQILRLPRKMNLMLNSLHTWKKRYLQCVEQHMSPSNLTKYCACHEKWISCWILFTHETLFTMRGATYVTLQPHQILRLPRKMTFQNLRQICWKRLKCHFQCATDPTMIRDRSDHENAKLNPPRRRGYFRARQKQILLKITTFRAPAIIPNFTEYCACHEKWHLNFTKYCACHEKWHLNFTKYCACHEKWHMNFTKCCACHKKWHIILTYY